MPKQMTFIQTAQVEPTWPTPECTPSHRIREAGPTALNTVEILSVILGMPRPEHLRQIRDLLQDAGGLAKLQSCSVTALTNALGTEKRAERLRAALALTRRMTLADPEKRPQIQSPTDVANLLMVEMGHLEQEQLRVLLLNTRHHVVRQVVVYVGNVNTSLVRIGELFREAVRDNATAVILCHNHPSGSPDPSPHDVALTREAVKAGQLLDIEILDHIIIGKGRYVSMRERGLGFSTP